MEPRSDDSESEDDTSIVDEDACDLNTLNKEFLIKCNVVDEEAISLKKIYGLSLHATSDFQKCAVGLSNGTVSTFDISNSGLTRGSEINNLLGSDSATICGVKYLDSDINSLLIGCTDGRIHVHDLRTGKNEHVFEDEEKKLFSCFDANSNGRVLCVGTEQIIHDVFLLFFDMRQKSLLGGYWESHQDDITDLRFHPENSDLMCSGSTDGLVNIYDISKTSEDDAIMSVVNTESSVQKLNWHKNEFGKNFVSCITHTNDLKLYEAAEGDLLVEFDRESVTKAIKRKAPSECYLVNCHNYVDDSLFLLSGSNHNKGEVLRSVRLQDKILVPFMNFEDNKQIIRDSVYNREKSGMITVGESGIVSLWSLGGSSEKTLPTGTLKVKSKFSEKKHSKKPY